MPVLTPISVQNYKPATRRREIPDSKAQGLYLVIQPKPSGRKSWAVRLRRPDGRTAKLTLGRVDLPDIETSDDPVQGAALTLGQARELAAQIDRKRARGEDVVGETKADKLRNRTAAADRAANTFGSIVREFFIDYRTKRDTRPRRWREDAGALGLRYPPGSDPAKLTPEVIKGGLAEKWADKPIADIDKYAVDIEVDEARKHGSIGKARKMYSALSVLFNWLPLKYGVDINPMIGTKSKPRTPDRRKRTLDKVEIKIFWQACHKIGGVFGPLYKTLLLTGCRLREPAGMTRAELGDGDWEVPPSRTKNNLPFLVPLPQQAFEIINSVPVPPVAKNDEASGHNSGLVFTTNGRSPVSGFSKMKKALDAEMTKIAGQPIKRWRVHDLRRTFSTFLNESPDDGGLGIAPHIVEACLNHISGEAKKGVAGVYNSARYLSEKRAALQRWAAHVEGLVAGRKAKVVPLRKPLK
jgi:integrase